MSTAPQLAPSHAPNPVGIVLRIAIITGAFAILGLGLGGFFGIVGLSIIKLTGEAVDMYMALFVGGLPGAVIGAAVGFVLILRSEREAFRARKV
jgi:hypothetical protein